MYQVLGIPFGFLLELIYKTIGMGSYAVSIILLTFITRILTVPSSIKQQKGMAKTQRIQSKIRKIQTKYAGDQRKIQEETTALYQREGYNPMGAGCTPMIFQFVILFGLIGAIYYPLTNFLHISKEEVAVMASALNIETKNIQAELLIMENIGKLRELFEMGKLEGVKAASLDAIGNVDFKIFGVSLGVKPTDDGVTKWVWLVPVLSFLSSILSSVYSMIKQKQQNPSAGSGPMMGCMMFGMPLLSLIFVINYPIGIGVYWIASSLFGFISTVIVGYFYSPKKTLAKLMIDETIERRSKEENQKLVSAKKDK
ncbi:MAG: YidC/Oxa1 family membrane protein insertase [Clostridia bacterium]|nr:YidC/Oxa1 family membrane protein insertase [Clostridia bacterium]